VAYFNVIIHMEAMRKNISVRISIHLRVLKFKTEMMLIQNSTQQILLTFCTFNNSVSSSDYTVLGGRMINE
jgi:hypothetical protein